MTKQVVKAHVPVHKLVVVTENHGGYLGGRCVICDATGWLDGEIGYAYNAKGLLGNELKHTRSCPVSPHALKVKEKH